ncbi:hypothetical protein P4133_23205 [Pseudomonas aeruginosa]|nr:hypothetical protein [Pseudomonas aeruginosa]
MSTASGSRARTGVTGLCSPKPEKISSNGLPPPNSDSSGERMRCWRINWR